MRFRAGQVGRVTVSQRRPQRAARQGLVPALSDLAVDGSAFIYVLYYTGAGTAPEDYHIDVYTAAGAPLVTLSPGVNVARLAVDYWRSVYGVNFTVLSDEVTRRPTWTRRSACSSRPSAASIP